MLSVIGQKHGVPLMKITREIDFSGGSISLTTKNKDRISELKLYSGLSGESVTFQVTVKSLCEISDKINQLIAILGDITHE